MGRPAVEPFSNVLIIAPVGAYVGRVKKGIEGAMARGCGEKTSVHVVLVLGSRWAKDSTYLDLTQPLITTFENKQYQDVYPRYSCKVETLDIEDEDSCTIFLVQRLASLFSGRYGDSAAYVDLTSAPKEWVLACISVANFFDFLYLYYVKPKNPKVFSDYKNEIDDEGLPFELVKQGFQARELSDWLTRGTERWRLFHLLCQITVNTSAERKKPLNESVIEVSRVVAEAPRFIKRWAKKGEGGKRRGLGKYLNAIEKHRLFIRVGKNYIRMTDLGLALGRGLFPEIFSRQGSTKAN